MLVHGLLPRHAVHILHIYIAGAQGHHPSKRDFSLCHGMQADGTSSLARHSEIQAPISSFSMFNVRVALSANPAVSVSLQRNDDLCRLPK